MGSFNWSNGKVRFDVFYNVSQDIPNNRSRIGVTVELVKISQYATGYNVAKPFTLKIGAHSYTISKGFDLASEPVGYKERWISDHFCPYVTHDNSGYLAPMTISIAFEGATLTIGSVYKEQTVAIPTIPRSASISVTGDDSTWIQPGTNAMLFPLYTINIDRKSSAYYHIVRVKIGDGDDWEDVTGWDGIPKGTGVHSFTNRPTWSTHESKFKTRTSLNVYFKIETYTSTTGSPIGVQTVNKKVNVSALVVPNFTLYFASDQLRNNKYIVGVSAAFIGATYSNVDLYGATIDKVTVVFNGNALSWGRSGHPTLFPPSATRLANRFPVTKTGTNSYSVYIEDSRGRKSVTQTGSFSAVTYDPPVINYVNVSRVSASSPYPDDPLGKNVKVAYSVKSTSGLGGKITINIFSGTTLRDSIEVTVPTSGILNSTWVSTSTLQTESYRIVVRFLDNSGLETSTEKLISKAFLLVDFTKNGVGFGGPSEDGKLTFYPLNMPIDGLCETTTGTLTVSEHPAKWTCKKYYDGTMEIWITDIQLGAPTTNRNSSFATPNFTWVYPTPFVGEYPIVVHAVRGGLGGAWASMGDAATTITQTSIKAYYPFSNNTIIYGSIFAKGRFRT